MKFTFNFGLKLKTLSVAGLLLSLSVPINAHEVGMQLWSVRHQMEKSVPDTFAEIKKWGIKTVEGGGNLYNLPVEQFKHLLVQNDIQIASVDTTYEEVRDNPMAIVYKARFFGARFATFYWITHDQQKGFNIEGAKRAVEVMNKAGKILKNNGITLQYHPHGFEFIPHQGETIMDYILQNTEHAKFQMDVFWVKQGGLEPAAMLKKYPGLFTSLHLKDRKPGTPNSSNGRADKESNVVLGDGDIGIASVIKEAKKQGIRYFFLEDESSRVMQQIPKSMAYLESLEGHSH